MCTVVGVAQGMAIEEFPKKLGGGQLITVLSGAVFRRLKRCTASVTLAMLRTLGLYLEQHHGSSRVELEYYHTYQIVLRRPRVDFYVSDPFEVLSQSTYSK
jgi:hypothetical protein